MYFHLTHGCENRFGAQLVVASLLPTGACQRALVGSRNRKLQESAEGCRGGLMHR